MRQIFKGLVFGGALAMASVGVAHASGWGETPAGIELSANVALTTDYVFRGISQTDESPAIQGGIDLSYGIFYAGIWASNLDFGGVTAADGSTVDVANIEVDYYGGIKKALGGVTFDLGAIYYTYPNAHDGTTLSAAGAVVSLSELDYWELKVGASGQLAMMDASLNFFYSPDWTGELGDNITIEGKLAKEIGRGITLSGTLGYIENLDDNAIVGDLTVPGNDSFVYWNVGAATTLHEKFTLDLRYWDTADATGCGSVTVFQCDGRIVATVSASF